VQALRHYTSHFESVHVPFHFMWGWKADVEYSIDRTIQTEHFVDGAGVVIVFPWQDNVVIPLHALAHSKVGHKGGVPKRIIAEFDVAELTPLLIELDQPIKKLRSELKPLMKVSTCNSRRVAVVLPLYGRCAGERPAHRERGDAIGHGQGHQQHRADFCQLLAQSHRLCLHCRRGHRER
jgi:hypothetical protein